MFVMYCVDKPGSAPLRAATRAAHLDFIKANLDKIVIAGPMLTEDGSGMVGSMLVLNLPNRAAVEEFAGQDPYARAGLFESVIIRPFRQVVPGL